jgi:hypothetical protein
VIGPDLSRVFLHALRVDAAKPGSLSERQSGSILPEVDVTRLMRVLMIGQGIEAAFDVIMLSAPGCDID